MVKFSNWHQIITIVKKKKTSGSGQAGEVYFCFIQQH